MILRGGKVSPPLIPASLGKDPPEVILRSGSDKGQFTGEKRRFTVFSRDAKAT
jgi:hypothetical protein